MKKLAMTAIAAAAVLGAGAAHAYTLGTVSNGFVVPNVIKEANGATTSVGIINHGTTSVPVYWTFFDQDSGHVADGCFLLTAKDFEPFVWSEKAGLGMDGYRGYLVFATGNTTGTPACTTSQLGVGDGLISGSAFYVDPVAKDVAFTPVIDGPLTIAATTNLSLLGPLDLTAVAGAAQVPVGGGAATPSFALRYYIDNVAGGTDTNIVVWSTGDHSGTYTVFMYDTAQNRRSVNFKLDRTELDWFNPETIVGRPLDFTDGFFEWQPSVVPTGAPATGSLVALGGSLFTYSVISAPAFGAVQTLLGAHTN